MDKYTRTTLLFDLVGISLSAPVDRLPPGRYRLLENVRSYGKGRIIGRQGQFQLSQQLAGGVCHSIYSWNDPVPSPTDFPTAYSTQARLAGVGANLYGAQSKTGLNNFGVLVEGGFSGNPLSFVTVPSDFTPRPWVLIGDSSKMRKDSSETFKDYQIGIAPPNIAPTIAFGAADPTGPDIGETNEPYVYAFRARADSKLCTGAISDLGPAVRAVNGLSPSSAAGATTPPTDIVVTLTTAHPDPQVFWIDVFRFGGSLTQWTYIGTMQNIAGNVMTDNFNDLAIAANQTVAYGDNPQPFVSLDNSKDGTCTLTALGTGLGATLTITAGDTLRAYAPTADTPYYPLGTQISVEGTLFTFYASPTSTTVVELLEDPPAGLAGGTFRLNSPEMWKQPIPCLWGPYGGGETGIFVFACGDAMNSGNLYWTKGNHPENHPAVNTLTITSGSETLMNGCMYGGEPFVFSTNRLFRMYPTLGQATDFIAIEVPNSKGLYARWGLTVTPHGIAFIGKDGIYLTSGGAPESLTDTDLYPIFPRESSGVLIPLAISAFPVIDGMLNTSFSPPDFSLPNSMRLSYGDGFLQFDYIDQTATRRTLVYNFASKGWESRDTFPAHPVAAHYFEVIQDSTTQANNWQQFIFGTTDGYVCTYDGGVDFGAAIAGHIRTGSYDKDDPRPRDLWGDIEIDLDTECDAVTVEVGMDNFSYFTNTTSNGLNLTGRRRALLDINAGQGQYGYNIGLDITWSDSAGSRPYFYFWGPSWLPKPELSALRFTGFDDLGYPGAKFIQGFKLRADTLDIARTVEVLDDFNVAHPFTPATVQHPREQTIAYSFNTPFISHLVRFAPQDAAFWRIEGVEWIWEPAPELVTTWTTQETTHDFNGWFAHRDGYLPILSSDVVTFTVQTRGNPNGAFVYSLPTTASVYSKIYSVLEPMKALAVTYSLTSPAGFRVFDRDLEFRVKQWGSEGPYISKMGIGDLTRTKGGARI
jgi:hypothetical protein